MKLRHCLNRPGCTCGLLHAALFVVPPYRDGNVREGDDDEPTLPSARHPHPELELDLPTRPWWQSLLGLFVLE